ncbi:MAG TPA: DUF86 domain-containing protein [Povalibacter sp.]|uniref:type VII toxin-antitoxin system HepT family RNase toxin n=1 Tax=Povalibacter sp. TaxID=1962978 RepID=UPI002CFAFF38|nr:DUF86 domain-containing protein [Povalibacter sp.]HMN44176.1 DUF86 domain-containing protein [Povalibacter sp.]
MNIAARKLAALERCVERARNEHELAGGNFRNDFTRQDAAILNVTRACEAAIDLANMAIRKHRLGVPGDAREGFALLERGGLVSSDLSARLQRMVGFRNIAVHQYQDLDIDIAESVIRDGLDDLLVFSEGIRARL